VVVDSCVLIEGGELFWLGEFACQVSDGGHVKVELDELAGSWLCFHGGLCVRDNEDVG